MCIGIDIDITLGDSDIIGQYSDFFGGVENSS